VLIAVGIPINQDDSAAKIATELHDHRARPLLIADLSVVYATSFVSYLAALHDLLREAAGRPRIQGFVLGGVIGTFGLSTHCHCRLLGTVGTCGHMALSTRFGQSSGMPATVT
jgi:hypothetical protein